MNSQVETSGQLVANFRRRRFCRDRFQNGACAVERITRLIVLSRIPMDLSQLIVNAGERRGLFWVGRSAVLELGIHRNRLLIGILGLRVLAESLADVTDAPIGFGNSLTKLVRVITLFRQFAIEDQHFVQQRRRFVGENRLRVDTEVRTLFGFDGEVLGRDVTMR